MSPKTSTKVPVASTPDRSRGQAPEDNGYDPQCGAYDPCYSGDLDEQDTEFEERDAKVDATREEFKHQDKPGKPEAWD